VVTAWNRSNGGYYELAGKKGSRRLFSHPHFPASKHYVSLKQASVQEGFVFPLMVIPPSGRTMSAASFD
jgi:hypothetical protein